MKFKTALPYAGLFVLAIAAGIITGHFVFQSRHAPPRPQTTAVLLHDAKPLPTFDLTGTDGKPFTKQSLIGHWSFLYFGYTHCPDACPTTLSALDHMMAALTKLPGARKPTVYFISVDPKRDDPALLKNYALYFNPNFVGATGSLDALRALTGPLGADFSYTPASQEGSYSVNHSSFVVLVDKEGEEVAVFDPPLNPRRMSADYLSILNYYGETE